MNKENITPELYFNDKNEEEKNVLNVNSEHILPGTAPGIIQWHDNKKDCAHRIYILDMNESILKSCQT